MHEEHALAQSPEGCRTKFIRTCGSLSDSIGESLPHVMHQEVGVQVDLLARQCRARVAGGARRDGCPGGERGGMTSCAADRDELGATVDRGGRGRRRYRGCEHTHEVSKGFDVRQGGRRVVARCGGHDIGVLRCDVVGTAGGCLVTFLREQLIGDAHLDVVSLAGKHQQRLVLCLPTEAGDAAVVRAQVDVAFEKRIGVTVHTFPAVVRRIGVHVRKDCRIRNRLDEARSEHRRGNAEREIRVAALPRQWVARRRECRLRDIAGSGIGPAADDEQIMNPAVVDSVRFNEAHFPDGAVGRDEPRNRVGGAGGARHAEQRVGSRATATHVGLRMAGSALIRVEPRPQAVSLSLYGAAHHFDGIEPRHAVFEVGKLVGSEPGEREGRPIVGRGMAQARIGRPG